MKASLLLSLATVTLSRAVLACQVTINGEDKTDEFYIAGSDIDESYVDCVGHYKCQDAVITDCPRVKCVENEACNGAQIVDFTDSVLCEGLHACHRTEMTAAVLATDIKQTVSCIGSGACDVAQVSGNLEQVTCSGVKACRKVTVKGSKLVKCHDGHEKSVACEGFATLETECLYCGKNGCENYINMCRYKIIGDSDSESEKYSKCQPETIVGDCPSELESELRLELSGKEEMETEGGLRRNLRL